MSAPDISLLPRIALLYNCTIDHLFGMDTIATSRTPMQEETLRSLMKSENYSAMLNLLLTECEAHSNNFQLLYHTLHFASRHNLYDHPELPRILPLIAHCENHCADQDLFHTILSYGLILSAKSNIPMLHAKTLEFYHTLPNQFAARERFVHFFMQGDELKQNILQNVWFYFEDAFKFLHHLAENAETIEEQMHLHQQRADIYDVQWNAAKSLHSIMDILSVFSGDNRYKDIKPELMNKKAKGESINMCIVIQTWEEKGIKKERLNTIQKMLRRGYSKEEILDWEYTEEEYAEAERQLLQPV